MKGKFITFEGTEGVGKSTQVQMVGEYLEKTNQPYVITREPGGDKVAEKIRNIILDANNDTMTYETEALLYAAARAQHVKNVIIPALDSGLIVLCDRFVDSSVAYQSFGRELGLEYVLNINAYALKNCPPDATILLDMPPIDAFKRKGGADKGDRLEISGDEFFNRVNEGYSSLKKDKNRVIAVDAYGSREEIFERIIKALREKNIIK